MNLWFRLLKVLWLSFLAWARRQPRRGIADESVLRFLVWPNDLDQNLHMNNGRYLTLMDLGRIDLSIRGGLLPPILRQRWRPTLAGATIQYRKQLGPFERYELRTRVIGWDDGWIYMRQDFFKRDGSLSARALVRGVFVGPRGRVPVAEVLREIGHSSPSPEFPSELTAWLQGDDELKRSLSRVN